MKKKENCFKNFNDEKKILSKKKRTNRKQKQSNKQCM